MSVQVLFLSSNAGAKPEWAHRNTSRDLPSDNAMEVQSQNWLEVDREFTSLQAALGFPGLKGNNVLQTLPDVRWMAIDQLLIHVTERVVLHFSGHGDPSGALYMRKDNGAPVAVEPKHLVEVVSRFRDRIPLVVLNACYSERLAQALTGSIDVVIGMTHAVEDSAAISFSQKFYQNLIFGGQAIGHAFAIAKAAIAAEFRRSGNEPAILARPGVDPGLIILFERPLRDDQGLSGHHLVQILRDQEQRLQEEMDSLRFDLGKLVIHEVSDDLIRECVCKLAITKKGLDGRKTGLYLAQIGLPSGVGLVAELKTIEAAINEHIREVDQWNEELRRARSRMLDQQRIVKGIGTLRM
jgi:hypothetical protein